jgi:hypothetical protein
MSSSDNTNNDTFPYGKYPTNIVKLMQIASTDPDSKEGKLLLCMAWCKDKIPQFNGQVIMDMCVASIEIKGKFLHEMNKEEFTQTMDNLMKHELD